MTDLSDIYADMAAAGLAKSATVGATTANVLLDMADIEIMGGTVQAKDYQMRYETATFPTLGRGSAVTVAGIAYTVREVAQVADGLESIALLSKT